MRDREERERNNDPEAVGPASGSADNSKLQKIKRMVLERTSKQVLCRARPTTGVRGSRSHVEMIPGRTQHTRGLEV